MLYRIAVIVTAAGLIALGLVSTDSDHSNLRRRLQQVVDPQSLWGPPANSGGFGGPPPQQQGFGGPPPQQQQGFGGPPLQQEQGFGGPPPQQQQGFGGPPPQQQQGFGGPPLQQPQGFGGPPPPQQEQGFGGPPPQQEQGFGGPPPRQQQGFGGPPPQQEQGFGGPPPQQEQGFGGPPPQQEQGFGGPPPQQEQGFGGPPPQQQQQAGHGGPPPQKQQKAQKAQKPPPPPPQQQRQQQQEGQQAGQQESGACAFREPQEAKVLPTWTASFPGSGAKLLWTTIEQLTGITTTDDNDGNGRLKKGTCVSVKTHFPTSHVSPKFFVMDTSQVKHAILLLRNPIDVMPSYFKFLHRMDAANDPTVEPPVDRWVAWRNENFNEQIAKWAEHTDWWMKNYQSSGKLMILPFEHFTDPQSGPETLKAIGFFLGSVDPAAIESFTPDNELGCVWNRMIGETFPGDSKGGKKKKKVDTSGFPRFPYTLENLETLVTVLKDLKKEYGSVPQLSGALGDYLKKATSAKKKVQKLLEA